MLDMRVMVEQPGGRPRRRRRHAPAVVLLVLVLSSACPHSPPPRPPCASTPGQVFLGLYSIFYRGNEVANGPVPGWPPVALSQAAEYLLCDPDRSRQPGRIRYAAMKLAAAEVLLARRKGDPHLLEEFTRTLSALKVPLVLVRLLSKSKDATTLPQLESVAGEIIDSDERFEGLQRNCCACLELGQCQIGSTVDNVAVAEFKLDINRDASCLFHTIDPTCWPKLAPPNFKQTFELDGSTCTGADPVCRSNHICNNPLLPAPLATASPPSAGTPWCGLLFEDFFASASGISAEFKNVLEVNVKQFMNAGDTIHWMDYGLCESRDWSVTNTTSFTTPPTTGTCALDRDCGFAAVRGTIGSGTAYLFGTKRVRFTSVLPNNLGQWAPAVLEVMVKNTAVAVCTTPASACPGAATAAASCPAPPPGSTAPDNKCTCPAGDACNYPSPLTPNSKAPYCAR